MGWAVPRTWTTADLATAAMLNQDMRDNPSFLHDPPCCRVYNNANLSIANATDYVLHSMNAEYYDTDVMHDLVTNNSRITIKTAGKYLVVGRVSYASNTTGTRGLRIVKNNGAGTNYEDVAFTPANTAAQSTFLLVATVDVFVVNDFLELGCYQTSGAALNSEYTASLRNTPHFEATWLSG